MLNSRFALFVFGTASCALIGCNSSPVRPSTSSESHSSETNLQNDPLTALARPSVVEGTYQLTFLSNGQPVMTLPTCDGELVLKAHVQATLSSTPATSGTVVYEYCSYGGVPNDITRADEAPLEVCQAGDGRWRRLGSLRLNQSGDAYLDFGVVRIPRTVGFRFNYSPQNGEVATGTGGPADFTWSAGTCP